MTTAYITGNTYPIKDEIKAAGGKWDADYRCWKVEATKADRFDGRDGVTVVRPWEWDIQRTLDEMTQYTPGAWQRANDLLGFTEAKQVLRDRYIEIDPHPVGSAEGSKVRSHKASGAMMISRVDGDVWKLYRRPNRSSGIVPQLDEIVGRRAAEVGLEIVDGYPPKGF
jgi:hypothetical protein